MQSYRESEHGFGIVPGKRPDHRSVGVQVESPRRGHGDRQRDQQGDDSGSRHASLSASAAKKNIVCVCGGARAAADANDVTFDAVSV